MCTTGIRLFSLCLSVSSSTIQLTSSYEHPACFRIRLFQESRVYRGRDGPHCPSVARGTLLHRDSAFIDRWSSSGQSYRHHLWNALGQYTIEVRFLYGHCRDSRLANATASFTLLYVEHSEYLDRGVIACILEEEVGIQHDRSRALFSLPFSSHLSHSGHSIVVRSIRRQLPHASEFPLSVLRPRLPPLRNALRERLRIPHDVHPLVLQSTVHLH